MGEVSPSNQLTNESSLLAEYSQNPIKDLNEQNINKMDTPNQSPDK